MGLVIISFKFCPKNTAIVYAVVILVEPLEKEHHITEHASLFVILVNDIAFYFLRTGE